MSRRRDVLAGLAGLAAAAAGSDAVPAPGREPPLDSLDAFLAWAEPQRLEPRSFLVQRWNRYRELVKKADVWGDENARAFLVTPRQEFVTPGHRARAYEWHYLDIGYGVTIAGPHTVAKMTSALAVRPGDKVLEIGTGSGYHAACLSYLTDQVHTVEIIPDLARRTSDLYGRLVQTGYARLAAVRMRQADGYDGWEERAPFDRIVVTCGIDHVPPPLLAQLKPDGVMLIPVGPPGAQHVLKLEPAVTPSGIRVRRTDIYGGVALSFVPFRRS